MLGLELARDMGIKVLEVIGDSDLVVMQVKDKFSVRNGRLRRYIHAVWDSIELFDAFAIKEVPREQNAQADALDVAAATLQPCESLISGESKMEIIFRPSVPDNF